MVTTRHLLPAACRLLPAAGWVLGMGLVGAVLTAAAGHPHEAYFDARIQLAGARDVLAGVNPYGVYYQSPLWSSFFLMPFALLPEAWSYVAWFWANLLAWAATCWLLTSVAGFPGGRAARALAAGLLMVYAPAVWSLHGQMDGFMALGLVGGLALMPLHPFAAGVAIAMLLVKPHLALVPLALLALGALRSRRLAVLFGLAAGSLGLLALSLLLQSAWPFRWLEAVAQPPADMVLGRAKFAQTVSALAGLWAPGWLAGPLGWAVGVAASIAAVRWVWVHRPPPAEVAALGAGALFLVTPYAQGYDLSLLLLPLGLAAGRSLPLRTRRTCAVLAGVLLVFLFAMATAYLGWPQPVLVLSAPLALALWWLSRRSVPSTLMHRPEPRACPEPFGCAQDKLRRREGGDGQGEGKAR